MSPQLNAISSHGCFDGTVAFYSHHSTSCATTMRFGIFLPPQATSERCPVLFYLPGLTCTEETFFAKSGAQRFAAQHGLILVAPDTSPRNLDLPGESVSWDFGSGAGFYVDATQPPWAPHYRLFSYVTEELPALICAAFPADRQRHGIFGHSMGGHGALVCALRNPAQYRSVSAFAPVCAPMACPWGQKAFSGYLGPDENAWKHYDATQLLQRNRLPFEVLVDQGEKDKFLSEQLKPDLLLEACRHNGQQIELRRHADYDHSYYFVTTFMEDHIVHHAQLLRE